jgi:hypothetical protein
MKEAVETRYEKLKDQFSSPTRNIRRNLLISASLSLILLVVGTEIDSLFGVKFKDNIPVFYPLGALFILVFYEFISFISYAITDYISWKLKPYEKTYQFTEEKLSEIIKDLKSSSENLTTQGTDAFKDIELDPILKFEIQSVPYGPLIDPVIFQQDLENGKQTISPTHREVEEKYRSEIENKAEKFIKEVLDEKTKELNKLLEREINNVKNIYNEELSKGLNTIEENLSFVKSTSEEMNDFVGNYKNNLVKYHEEIKKFNVFQLVKIYFIDFGVPITLGLFSMYMTCEFMVKFTKKVWYLI